MTSKPRIIIVHETLAESIAKDAVSTIALLASIAVGVWISSAALQWMAGVIWVLWIISKSMSVGSKDNWLTVEQARKRLDEIEAAE